MKKATRNAALLVSMVMATMTATAQNRVHRPQVTSTDMAVMLDFEHNQQAVNGTPGFWLKGAGIDGAATFWKGFGVAVNLTGMHAKNVNGNVSVGEFDYVVGPRYTFNTSPYTDRFGALKKHHTQVYGQWLFGGVHGFDSSFPSGNGVATSANAFAMQLGTGADVAIAKGFGIRAFELDWLHTTLPNNASNTQNDLRIGFGVSYRR